MKAPADFDPDVHTVLELVQHAGEILARLPLSALRAHLEQHREGPDEPYGMWYSKALNVALNKVSGEFDLDKLADLLGELRDDGFDLGLTGFSEDEIDGLLETGTGGGRSRVG